MILKERRYWQIQRIVHDFDMSFPWGVFFNDVQKKFEYCVLHDQIEDEVFRAARDGYKRGFKDGISCYKRRKSPHSVK